jgi:hypothetical protein
MHPVTPSFLTPVVIAPGWRRVPDLLAVVGAAGVLLGVALDVRRFAFAWLLAFLFWLSVALGALFLVLLHHLCNAAWSAPLRRVAEHLAGLVFPWLALAFLPVAVLAPRIYEGMRPTAPAWYAASGCCFLVWWGLANRLRRGSFEQDRTGAAACTTNLRRWSGVGVVGLAITLTLAAMLWLQRVTPGWFPTMGGFSFFAGSVWVSLAVVYLIAVALRRGGGRALVLRDRQFHDLGTLLFVFTILHAYFAFSQYLIVWQANLPAEAAWYGVRQRGTWFAVGLVLVFGHFLVPFLALLRVDLKLKPAWMVPLCGWIALMHYADLAFHIDPAVAPAGWPGRWVWLDAACVLLIGGVLARVFLRHLAAHAPFPVNDPHLRAAAADDDALDHGPLRTEGGFR